ncbi:hypothetical protein M8C21_026743 [Ambrosia artemisiifolia]|uniref:Uncharacterized protein n=1 Tax=Ambrosia artemisiifolia TaxID=4212 RepID=A0AAD5CDL2_AMBAR|nr:hypothetical protein M8C21_026743 [Ambrosia artemisiifolia]
MPNTISTANTSTYLRLHRRFEYGPMMRCPDLEILEEARYKIDQTHFVFNVMTDVYDDVIWETSIWTR